MMHLNLREGAVPWMQDTHDFPTHVPTGPDQASWLPHGSRVLTPSPPLSMAQGQTMVGLWAAECYQQCSQVRRKEWVGKAAQPREGQEGRTGNMRSRAAEAWTSESAPWVWEQGEKNEVSGKRKEREMAISCLLANKLEGSEPWPPSPPLPLLSH